VDTWLDVIPQVIARIATPEHHVRLLVHGLLERLGKVHPQALVYPLTLSAKSDNIDRRNAAQRLLVKLKDYYPLLVDQAILVSEELIRTSVLWLEKWRLAIERASAFYFGGEQNIEGMLAVLQPLHKEIKHAETLSEISFQQQFKRDLDKAWTWCCKYKSDNTNAEITMSSAWDLYHKVYGELNQQFSHMSRLELRYVSPRLLRHGENLDLAIPGTYARDGNYPKIASFQERLKVINSKQRPRKLTIWGSDGTEYEYLLKGGEDTRQDERVMQLFGLVNSLLAANSNTASHDFSIRRYSVIPLNANAGLIGWVKNSDTFYSLIIGYRRKRNIAHDLEHRLMLKMSTDYDRLSLMQKIEVFEYALENTAGQDLYKILWFKSRTSETWLSRRNTYTRSLAVMSMVGYILGLGDRHPSNLMIEKYTGKIVHIDFGDCFEVAMQRSKYPEKIPFRLTRMLVNAMEACGIEGTFRSTCDHVMRVIRSNANSVLAMLEAFVHDPLINWRLVNHNTDHSVSSSSESSSNVSTPSNHSLTQLLPQGTSPPSLSSIESPVQSHLTLDSSTHQESLFSKTPIPQHTINKKALTVISRINDKLNGTDFDTEQGLTVEDQVELLIEQATSNSNLCQCYTGWISVW